MGDSKPAKPAKLDWLCKFCARGANDAPLSNHGGRACCRGCNVAKGAAFLRNDENSGAAASSKGKGRGKGAGGGVNFAERQVQNAAAANKAELAALRKKVASLEAAQKKGDDDDAEMPAASAEADQIDQLQAAIKSMEAHKGLPGVAASLAGLQSELAAARQRRDASKPPVARLLVAQRTLAKRTTALEKVAAAKTAAKKALDDAEQAEQAATDALAEAQGVVDGWYASNAFASDCSTSGHDDTEWDALAALLTQIEAMPAAIRAGNGESAWSSMQTNGLEQVRSMVSSKLGKRAPSSAASASTTPVVAERVAALQLKQPPVPKATGMEGLKGIFTTGAKVQTTWSEKMHAAQAAQEAEDAKEATRR